MVLDVLFSSKLLSEFLGNWICPVAAKGNLLRSKFLLPATKWHFTYFSYQDNQESDKFRKSGILNKVQNANHIQSSSRCRKKKKVELV